MSVLGALTGANAAKKSAKQGRKLADQREAGALGELTPEAMQGIMNMLMQRYMAMLAPNMMSAQQGLAAKAGRSGMMGSGLYSQLQAGIPGQFANAALGKATEGGLGIASQRANIRMQKPIITNPARTGLTDLVDLVAQYYSGGQMSTGSTKQQMNVLG